MKAQVLFKSVLFSIKNKINNIQKFKLLKIMYKKLFLLTINYNISQQKKVLIIEYYLWFS